MLRFNVIMTPIRAIIVGSPSLATSIKLSIAAENVVPVAQLQDES